MTQAVDTLHRCVIHPLHRFVGFTYHLDPTPLERHLISR
jgi:hypothetical protein